MPPDTSYAQPTIPPRKPPPRLRGIVVLALFALFMTLALVYKSMQDFAREVPSWMIGGERWYDHAFGALWYLSIALACLAYLRYRLRLRARALAAKPRRWRFRREVRAVLYVFAATLLVQLPLTLYRLVVALNDPDNSFSANQMIGDSIPAGLFPPLVGVVILVYDRRRIRREERQAGNLCQMCGYDLRATPQRCPECGAVPDRPE